MFTGGGGKPYDRNSPCFLDELSRIRVRFSGRASAATADLGLEGSGLQGQADTGAVAPADPSPVCPRSALLRPSWRGHGPHLGLPAPLLGAAAAGAAAATGDQQQQQHGGWRVRGKAGTGSPKVRRERALPPPKQPLWRCRGLGPRPGSPVRNTRGSDRGVQQPSAGLRGLGSPRRTSSASQSSAPSAPGLECWAASDAQRHPARHSSHAAQERGKPLVSAPLPGGHHATSTSLWAGTQVSSPGAQKSRGEARGPADL